jgi:hypothetical protein
MDKKQRCRYSTLRRAAFVNKNDGWRGGILEYAAAMVCDNQIRVFMKQAQYEYAYTYENFKYCTTLELMHSFRDRYRGCNA